jgi:Mrp family chromosome partitioning ATPase
MNRREFTVEAALLLLGGTVITITGCGGGAGSSPTAASAPPLKDAVGDISANHGHAAVITAARLGETGTLDLDIRGTASHSHMVSLSDAEIANIRMGLPVAKQSSGNSHTHMVAFNEKA